MSTMPVDVTQVKPREVTLEPLQDRTLICRCGHPVGYHGASGLCNVKGRATRDGRATDQCECALKRPIGRSNTARRFRFNGSEAAVEQRGHPLLRAIESGAHFEWLPDEPRCDECGRVAGGEISLTLDAALLTRVTCKECA